MFQVSCPSYLTWHSMAEDVNEQKILAPSLPLEYGMCSCDLTGSPEQRTALRIRHEFANARHVTHQVERPLYTMELLFGSDCYMTRPLYLWVVRTAKRSPTVF